MLIRNYELNYKTTANTDLIDLTGQLIEKQKESGVENGLAVVFVPGSTGAVTTIEYESGALSDLNSALERLAPQEAGYEHDRRWGDGNGYSHVRSALLGPSLSIPVIAGRLALGTWQQVILMDFDNRSRERLVLVQFMGEGLN